MDKFSGLDTWGREMEITRWGLGYILLFAVLHLVENRQNNAGTFHLGQAFSSLSSAQLCL